MAVHPSLVSQVNPLLWTLLAQPAIWTMPLAFVAMVVVSLLTAKRIPADVNLNMPRLHVPESLGLRSDYIPD